MSPTTRAAVRAAQADALAEAAQFQAPTLRKSTLVRVEEAQKERQRTEQVCPLFDFSALLVILSVCLKLGKEKHFCSPAAAIVHFRY